LGAAPVPFAFLALGSQGRMEQTLLTDQDNAILFASPGDPAALAAAERYFAALGERVCEGLEKAGYARCQGGVMASNPRWRMTLEGWKGSFDAWIGKAEPQELLEFSIFFDFRAVHGEARLAHELRVHIQQSLRQSPAFFPHLAQNALLFKPPYRLFGKILLGGETAGLLNLKDAMMPIVSFARLYALKHNVEETHTLGRLEALAQLGAIGKASLEETGAAYNLLMQLRLRRQAAALEAGATADNLIHPGALTQTEETLLKQAFAQIAAVQKKIGTDFLGGTV
jgi:CBS domain-containing protein